jgi:hypothetical protein
MKTRLLTLMFVVLGTLLAGCDPGIALHIENNTNVTVCFEDSGGRAALDPASTCDYAQLAPSESVDAGIICLPDDSLRMMVTRRDTREILHSSTSTCGEWDKSGAEIVVVEVDGRIEARASLDDLDP